VAAPIRVGILHDMSPGPPGPSDIETWLRVTTGELVSNGRLERDVEFVHAWGLGLPAGTAAAVERAYEALAQQDVLLVVGPAIGDNALIATPLAQRHAIPTINWAGAERARSDYMFQLQIGSHEDESIVLARYLASLGVRHVGVVHDRSSIGDQHLLFLLSEANILGLNIDVTCPISPLAQDATAAVDRMLGAQVEAIAYLGLGLAAPSVARTLTAQGWEGPRVMNTAGMRGYDSTFGRIIEGWIYIDMYSDSNATLAAVRQRPDVPVANSSMVAKRYDLARLVAEGLARAPEKTRDGIKDGLEQIKWLAAAEGHEGTLLGFGKYDRGALHGRYLVLRRWIDRQSIEVCAR
jgi:branched-chain amino acid transport system substrate-binding protein